MTRRAAGRPGCTPPALSPQPAEPEREAGPRTAITPVGVRALAGGRPRRGISDGEGQEGCRAPR